MPYITKPSHNMTLHLKYNLPLSKAERATLSMYEDLCKNKKFIEVLGNKCAVRQVDQHIYRDSLYPQLRVDISLVPIRLSEDKL